MKSCWVVTRNNRAELEWRDAPVPQPAAGEVIVEVHATALNWGEFVVGGAVHGGDERIGGLEAAGIVHAVGEGVSGFRPGDRVFGRVRGGFSEYAIAVARQLMPLPERLDWVHGAATPSSFLTAYEMLYPPYGKLKAGEWLLIVGASSGSGAASIQLARLIGARTIGTSGSSAKLEKLMAAGLDIGIQTRKPDFARQVMEVTGRGADLIVNLVGGSMFAECVSCLARRGRLAIVGYVDGSFRATVDLNAVHVNRHEIFGISTSRQTPDERAEVVHNFKRDVLPALADGRVVPMVDRVLPFDELPAAKACMESSAMTGKIVVRIR